MEERFSLHTSEVDGTEFRISLSPADSALWPKGGGRLDVAVLDNSLKRQSTYCVAARSPLQFQIVDLLKNATVDSDDEGRVRDYIVGFVESDRYLEKALGLADGNPLNASRKPKPLPDDFAGAAHEWFVNIEATESDLDLDDLVHDLLVRSGLTQIGVASNRQQEITSTTYHSYPYFIVNRLAAASQTVSVKITYNGHDVRDLQAWAEQLCSNGNDTARLQCHISTKSDP